MRLTMTLRARQRLSLPINYQQTLQGLIYNCMQDREFARFLHEIGYTTENNRSFKLFTYSRLIGQYRIDRQHHKIQFEGDVKWHVSSIVPQFIRELGRSVLTSEMLTLNGQHIDVINMSYEEEEIVSTPCRIEMLSPVTIHSTFESSDGRKTTQYYDPDDAAFSHLIIDNLRRKYAAYYDEEMDGDFHIRPLGVVPQQKVITKYKGFIIVGWNGQYELSGDPSLITFAHAVGIGSRNSQGFGMFELID